MSSSLQETNGETYVEERPRDGFAVWLVSQLNPHCGSYCLTRGILAKLQLLQGHKITEIYTTSLKITLDR